MLGMASVASAKIKLTFSPGVKRLIRNHPAQTRGQIEAELNGALQDIADGKVKPRPNATESAPATPAEAKEFADAAQRVLDSKQTIHLMCREEAKNIPALKAQYEQSAPNLGPAQGAATLPDLDPAKLPKVGGKAIIVIECSTLWRLGWRGGFGRPREPADNPEDADVYLDESMLGLIAHELLHVSHGKFDHTNKKYPTDFYDRFRRFFTNWLEDEHVAGPTPVGTFSYPFGADTTGRTDTTDAKGIRTIGWTSDRNTHRLTVTPDGHVTHVTTHDPGRGRAPTVKTTRYWIVAEPGGGRTEIRVTQKRVVLEGLTNKFGFTQTTTRLTYDAAGKQVGKSRQTVTVQDDAGRQWAIRASGPGTMTTFTGTEVFGVVPKFKTAEEIVTSGTTKTITRTSLDDKGNEVKIRRVKTKGAPATFFTWDAKTQKWIQVDGDPSKPKPKPKPKPEGTSALPAQPMDGGAFAWASPGLLFLPLAPSPRPGYRWGLTGGWLFRPGDSMLAVGVGGAFEHGLAPGVSAGGMSFRAHEIRLMAQARPGVALVDGRLLVTGVAGLGYVAQPTRSTYDGMSNTSTAHGVALGLGASGMFAVWRQLVVGGSLGTDLQWFGGSGQAVGSHVLDVEATAGWMF